MSSRKRATVEHTAYSGCVAGVLGPPAATVVPGARIVHGSLRGSRSPLDGGTAGNRAESMRTYLVG